MDDIADAQLQGIEQQLGPAFCRLHGGPDNEPALPGAYALLLHLDRPCGFSWRREEARLPAGWYVYAGSARGGGGIRARLRHHFRPDKRPHWHVDHLTTAARTLRALVAVDGAECAIVARLVAGGQCRVPIAGFGSSDCRCCPSHLLALTATEPASPRS